MGLALHFKMRDINNINYKKEDKNALIVSRLWELSQYIKSIAEPNKLAENDWGDYDYLLTMTEVEKIRDFCYNNMLDSYWGCKQYNEVIEYMNDTLDEIEKGNATIGMCHIVL